MESEFCAAATERQELLLERGVVEGKNLRGEDCGILCTGSTDGHRSDGDAGRHPGHIWAAALPRLRPPVRRSVIRPAAQG